MIYTPTLSGVHVFEPSAQSRSVLLFGLSGALTLTQLQQMNGFDEIKRCFVWYEPLAINVPLIELLQERESFQRYLRERGFLLSSQCRSLIGKTLGEQKTQLRKWLAETSRGREAMSSRHCSVPAREVAGHASL